MSTGTKIDILSMLATGRRTVVLTLPLPGTGTQVGGTDNRWVHIARRAVEIASGLLEAACVERQ